MAKGAYIGVMTEQKALSSFSEGDIVLINENGSPVEFYVAKHDYESGLNGAGRTLLVRKSLWPSTMAWDTAGSNLDFATSSVCTWLNSTYLELFDADVQTAIGLTTFRCIKGNYYDSTNTRTKGVFLPSLSEIGGARPDEKTDGSTISVISGLSDTESQLLRTPAASTPDRVYYRYMGTTKCYSAYVTTVMYVRPCFTLPSTIGIRSDGLITGAEAGIKSVARKIKGGYIGIEGEIYPNSVGLLPVGSTVKINENGSPVDYIVVHQGNPDTSMYDASCDGTWVLRKDIYGRQAWRNWADNNEYSKSTVNSYLNSTFLNLFDSDIKSQIQTVKIPYVNGIGTATIDIGSNGLSTQIFLLSGYEVGFTTSDLAIVPVDGAKLDYFELGAYVSTAQNKRIAYFNGSAEGWWLRSPNTSGHSLTLGVGGTGQVYNFNPSDEAGIRPAFILPSTLAVSNDTITGAQANKTTTGIARRIKKAYIGIGGVARPCWGGGELTYYGAITPLSMARYGLAATSVGNYALFVAGAVGSSPADAYDGSLTQKTVTSNSAGGARYELAATSVGNYALFGGGVEYGNSSCTSGVESFNTSLTNSWPSQGLVGSMGQLAATSVGNYALFGGGISSIYNGSYMGSVVAYDSSLVRTSVANLSVSRRKLAATSVGNYALFGGGEASSVFSNVVDAYDASLTRSIPNPLLDVSQYLAATSIGNYALFGGGGNSTGYISKVTAYDKSLTRTTTTSLSQARGLFSATSVGDFALFGGGYDITSTCLSTVDVYDTSLTRTIPTGLSVGRRMLAATSIGNYVLFGGGEAQAGASNVVDAYTVV